MWQTPVSDYADHTLKKQQQQHSIVCDLNCVRLLIQGHRNERIEMFLSMTINSFKYQGLYVQV